VPFQRLAIPGGAGALTGGALVAFGRGDYGSKQKQPLIAGAFPSGSLCIPRQRRIRLPTTAIK
jgi:hypothetical protein